MKCKAKTKKGKPCSIDANYPDGKCHVHSEYGIYHRQKMERRQKRKEDHIITKKKKETRLTRRNTYCEICGKRIWAMTNAKYLRSIGRCKEHQNNQLKSISNGNGRVKYEDYIISDEWKERRRRAKIAAGWRCQLCNKTGNDQTLHAHHRTYKNLGHEQNGDITVLCEDCHAKFHDIITVS